MNFILLSIFSALDAFDARIKDFEKEIEEVKTYLSEEIELTSNATEWQRKLVNLFSPDQLKENVIFLRNRSIWRVVYGLILVVTQN